MKNKIYYLLIPFVGLFILHFLLGLYMKVPVIWPDEYTYLFIAKYFGGETIIQGMPKTDITGSFGYSLLISPIFRFFDNPESIYRGVIIINGFFVSTLYIALFLFLKRIAGSNDRIALIISLAVCMFPAYLLQSNNAYTDSLTPSYFLFGIVAFQNMVKKKDLGSVVIFAVLAGFMNWIHIRMLPFSLISMTIIVFMFYKKQIKPIDAILGFGIIAVFILFGVIISDHISLVIHGSLSDKDRVLSSLINITEIVLIFAVLFILIFTLLKRKYSYLIFTASGILTGILFSENPLSFLIILIASIGVYSYKRKHTNLWTELLIGIFLSIVIAFLTYFAVPALSYFTIVLDRIRIWGINLSGVAYYAVFSTFLFALIGLVSIFYSGYSSFRKSGLPEEPENIKDFSTIRAPYFDFSDMWSKPDIMSLFFMIFTALGMVAITIFPKELTVQHYRADHLFYGRYIEVILAGFYAIGLYKIAKGTAREYLLISIISIFVFFSMSFLMMYVYGNVIASELSFKSVISFFPLRAVLGDINLFVFSLFAISGAVFFSIFNRFKPFLGNLILCIGLLLISLFTYYYVDYYYQTDKQERNKIIKYLENEFSDIDTINYDLSIYNEKSQNGLHYIWMMPEKHFNFFIPKQNKTISNLTIGSGNYGISVQKDALLYGIEHDGNDVLWIEEGALQTKFKYRIPNYFNIELDKDYVKGVFRSAFYKEDWINGKWEMIIPNIYNDSNLTLELIIASSDKKPHNLVIWLYDTEIFNKDIQNGTWKYTFNIKTGEILDKYRIRFFSDLTRDATDERILNGLKVFSFKLIDSTLINKKFFQFNNPKLQNTIIVEPRRNIDFSQLNLKAGDSISLPFRITNYGANKLELGKQDVFFKFKWFGFILKSLEHVQSHKLALNGDLAPGESVEVFLTMKVPAEAKKYFMDMNLFDKNDKELFDKYYKRQFLVDLREK